MASSVFTGAVYDNATYDSLVVYDSSGITITVDGVSSTGAVTTASVSADANFALPSVEATGQVSDVRFPGVIIIPSVEAIGSVTTATAFVSDIATISGVEATGSIDSVSTSITFSVVGNQGTGAISAPTITSTALLEVDSVSATGAVTVPSVSTTSIIVSVADRSNRREVYVPREKSRIVYVEAA